MSCTFVLTDSWISDDRRRIKTPLVAKKWAFYHSTRILFTLPQLTELELDIDSNADIEYVAWCLTPLNCLRGFKVYISPIERQPRNRAPPELSSFRSVIAHNPNLTHLHFQLNNCGSLNLSDLLGDIPGDRPLRLDHVSLDRNCNNVEALLPHIRHLSSFEFHSCPSSYHYSFPVNVWCPTFSRAKLFPPTIKVTYLDEEFLTYLQRHPGMVSLSVLNDHMYRETSSMRQGD